MSDDEFTPRLGRQRQQGGKRARRYLGRVVGAAARSAEKGAIGSRRFDGSRIGRGASMGRLLSSRDRFGGLRARRAVVKRSEEHTSELQSLMRISYAVFCLKKKNNIIRVSAILRPAQNSTTNRNMHLHQHTIYR